MVGKAQHSDGDGMGTAAQTASAPAPADSYRRVTLHDREIAYLEYEGPGPKVMLIHGVGASGAEWGDMVPLLAGTGAHVVAVDLPGHGRSAKNRGDYSLGAMASTLRDLLDHLAIDEVVLVGHSLGGGIALQFVYQFPKRASGLVLISSGGLGTDTIGWLKVASLPGSGLAMSAMASRATIATASWFGRQASRFGASPQILQPDSLARLREFSDRDTRAAFLATLRSVVDHSGQKVSALGKLATARHMPVLMIWGEKDPTIPLSHANNAAERLPSATLIVMPGVGHEPHKADPQMCAELIADYASDREGGATYSSSSAYLE